MNLGCEKVRGNSHRLDGTTKQTRPFGWVGGVRQQLMTQQEWPEHQQKMLGMSVEEGNRYREEWYNRLMERAQRKGIGMPDTPRPKPGSGMGYGMGNGDGMGHGGGMGSGGSMGAQRSSVSLSVIDRAPASR